MQLPQHTITILLGLVFCIMNPIICPMCLVYFLITTSTEKYNLLYVYTAEYESGGEVCPCQVSDREHSLLMCHWIWASDASLAVASMKQLKDPWFAASFL